MFTLRLLGGLALVSERDERVGRAAQKLRLAVLAVLASRPGVAITRDKLLALFWPESPAEEARHRLSAALYDLRRALGEDIFESRGDELSIPVGAVRCDVVEFEAAIDAGDWLTATRLYRGPFLDGVHIDDAPEFDEWVEQRRTQLGRSFIKALEEWARVCSAQPDHAGAVEAWQRLADADPLNDRLALGLMKAFEAAGNRAGALRHALVHEQRLRGEVGVEPDYAVRAYAETLRTSPSPIPPRAVTVDAPAARDRREQVTAVPAPNAVAPTFRTQRTRSRRVAEFLVLVLLLPAALSVLPIQHEARSASTVVPGTAGDAMQQGESLLRAGRFEPAVASFERAVALDSSSALARFRLAMATLWADQPGDKVDSRIAIAVERRDGLDESHRMLLDGFSAWRRGHWHEAEEVYRRVLTTSPSSVDARQELGEVLFHYNAAQGRSLDEARVEFERVVAQEPDHFGALWHLALIAARDHRVADVDRLTSRLLSLDPDAVRTIEVETMRASVLKDERGMDRLIERLKDADESMLFSVGWRLAVSARDLHSAERVFALLTDPRRGPNAQGIGQVQLFYLQLAHGYDDRVLQKLRKLGGLQFGGADAALLTLLTAVSAGPAFPAPVLAATRDSLVAATSRQTFHTLTLLERTKTLATLGAIHALLGDSARASAVARHIEAVHASKDERLETDARAALIRALIARSEGRHQDVIRWIDRSLVYRWFGHAVFDPLSAYSISRYVRAEALVALGRDSEADAWFATMGDHDPSDLAFLPLALDQRRRIASARGDASSAVRFAQQLQALR